MKSFTNFLKNSHKHVLGPPVMVYNIHICKKILGTKPKCHGCSPSNFSNLNVMVVPPPAITNINAKDYLNFKHLLIKCN